MPRWSACDNYLLRYIKGDPSYVCQGHPHYKKSVASIKKKNPIHIAPSGNIVFLTRSLNLTEPNNIPSWKYLFVLEHNHSTKTNSSCNFCYFGWYQIGSTFCYFLWGFGWGQYTITVIVRNMNHFMEATYHRLGRKILNLCIQQLSDQYRRPYTLHGRRLMVEQLLNKQSLCEWLLCRGCHTHFTPSWPLQTITLAVHVQW